MWHDDLNPRLTGDTKGENNFRTAVRSQNRLVNFLAILGVPTALAVWLGVFDAATVGAGWFWGVTAAIVIFQAVLYLVSTKYSETVPALHLENSELYIGYEDALAEIEQLGEEKDWLLTANRLGSYWATFQGLIQATDPRTEEQFCESCRLAISPMLEAAGILFNFGFDDVWSVAIYELEPTSEILEPVWFKRTEDHPSSGMPRSWRVGDGHVGSAFMQNRVLYTIDMADAEASMLLKPSAENGREYDDNVYRSFVSAPITLDLKSGPTQFGVLVITSNEIGRFDNENRAIVGHAAQVLAHLFDWRSRLQSDSR
ncbi:hypothetical protein [Aurantiacibacter rhizosphaerae]|uniref:GAF domain-containing protein n=1 Tax=Aurantiacibacter rhizosphaerae TaxID=2691582 RepID=A0A844X8Z1_9SPHN|nr:hypothetical protein [Aurantiacibacter rhizosphaerae]MWV26436.1 hypothetical protein [Aurantiacibacter rhizosphaerae]